MILALSDVEYQQSRDQFDAYAGLDGEVVPQGAPALRVAQIRLCRWQNKNFGFTADERTTLGVTEELGELIEDLFGPLETSPVYLGENYSHDADIAKVKDSIADAMVYTTQLLTANRLDMVRLWEATGGSTARQWETALVGAAAAAGRLSRAALKSAQKIRGFENREKQRRVVADNATRVFCCLRAFGSIYAGGIDVECAYLHTVDKVVLKRDWVADKALGGNVG